MNFFSNHKYKSYKKVKITMTNIIYQNKKGNLYDKRIMDKWQH